MQRTRRGVLLLIFVAALYAAVFIGRRWFVEGRVLRLRAGAPEVLHYDLVPLRLTFTDDELEPGFVASPPRVAVMRGTETVTTIGGIRETVLRREASGVWSGLWPVPWNAPVGDYRPVLLARGDLAPRLRSSAFRVGRRMPSPLPQGGFVVASLESVAPLSTMRVRAPGGGMTDWRGLLDWAQEIEVDAFWVLAGQSPGLSDGQVWVETNLKLLPEMARECHRRGLKFGVYAMYSLTMSDKVGIPGYEYALEIKDGRAVTTRAVSIRDRKRLDDVIEFLKPFAANPDVDFIGVDYIRNALGGYELVDDFVAEMPGVKVPAEWLRLSRDERMTWLARKKIMRRDKDFVEAWQWWRAHRVALLVKELKSRLASDKPLWAFTLTWDKGWDHGQDPVMMNDAGVDYDALMFYEADKEQYEVMMKDWHGYVRRGDVQLVPGDIFDWGLHQKDRAGPAEFARRMRAAIDGVYGDGPASAVFFHDMARLLGGRLGPWGTRGWADEARKVSRYVRSRSRPEKTP